MKMSCRLAPTRSLTVRFVATMLAGLVFPAWADEAPTPPTRIIPPLREPVSPEALEQPNRVDDETEDDQGPGVPYPALWTAAGVGPLERIEPSNVQHLGISDLDNVEVDDPGEFSAELEITWEHFESDDSSEQELELEIQYGLTSWLSSKLTLPYVWAGPNSELDHSGGDDLEIEFKTFLARFERLDIGTVSEINFPTGSSKVDAGEGYEAENKLSLSYYPLEHFAVHGNVGLISEEGDLAARHICSVAVHWVMREDLEFQSEYRLEGDSDDFRDEVEYYFFLNYLPNETWNFQLVLRGEYEDGEHPLEFGPGVMSEFPLGDELELQLNLGAFVGLTDETEDYGLRAQCSFGF